MKKTITFFNLRFVALFLMIFAFTSADAIYTPVAVTGLNRDVIAGPDVVLGTQIPAVYSNPATCTNAKFDSAGNGYNLVTSGYAYFPFDVGPSYYLGLSVANFPNFNPINSITTPGLVFQLAPHNVSNSLRLIGTAGSAKDTGTLYFSNPSTLIGDVYVCGASGGGSSTVTITLIFTDNSTQVFSGVVFDDWYNGTGIAIQGIGRVSRTSNYSYSDNVSTTNPRLYERKLSLAYANYAKQIRAVRFARTGGSATTSVLNIMAVSVNHQTCLPVQNLALTGTTMTSGSFSWSPSTQTGILGYEWLVNQNATPPPTDPNIQLTTNSNVTATGLNNGQTYYFHVRTKCSGTDSSMWNTLQFTTVTCPAPPTATFEVPVSGTLTTVSANIRWRASPSGWNGWDYILNQSASPTGTIVTKAPLDTTFSATGLFPGVTYYVHLRNKCPSPSNSVWISKSFTTLPCPSAGAPTIVSNTPGNITFQFPGNTTPGVIDYQYAITTTPSQPTVWKTTTNTTISDTVAVPGQTYYVWVRSNCSATNSTWMSAQFFNPFPACYTPDSIYIDNLNMHGADFKWNRSATVKFVYGYQYTVSTNPNPPAAGPQINDTFITINNLIAGVNYYMHVRTHCGTTNYSPWKTRAFTTPPTCQLPQVLPVVSNITSSSAVINWSAFPSIFGYEYFVSTNPNPPTIPGFQSTFNAYAPINLFSGTTYYFHLRVKCDTASTSYSPWSTTPFTTTTVCNAPTAPVVTGLGADSATIQWGGVAGALNYEVSLGTDPNPPVPPVVGIPVANTSYSSYVLIPKTVYYFHVRSFCGPSDLSSWQTVMFQTYGSLSVGGINSNGFNVEVYPNPVKDELTVSVKGRNNSSATINIVDMAGKTVQTDVISQDKTLINTSRLAPGMYLLKYVDSEHAGVIRIEKQ